MYSDFFSYLESKHGFKEGDLQEWIETLLEEGPKPEAPLNFEGGRKEEEAITWK